MFKSSFLAAMLLSVSLAAGATGHIHTKNCGHVPPKPTPTVPVPSNSNSNSNANSAANANSNANAAAVANGGNAVATGGNANANNNNNIKNDLSQTQAQNQSQSQNTNVSTGDVDASSKSESNVEGSGNSTVNVEGDSTVYKAAKIPVASAYAPTVIVSGDDSCLKAKSAGVQAQILGISFGKTTTDQDCELRKDSREAFNQGHPVTAFARWCQDPLNAKAAKAAGEHCPDGTDVVVVAPAPAPTAVTKEYVDEKVDRAFKATIKK